MPTFRSLSEFIERLGDLHHSTNPPDTSGRFRSPREPDQRRGKQGHHQRQNRTILHQGEAQDGSQAHCARNDESTVGGPARHEDEQCPGRVQGSGSVAEPLPPADRIEEWNRPHGSGKLLDSDPQEG